MQRAYHRDSDDITASLRDLCADPLEWGAKGDRKAVPQEESIAPLPTSHSGM